MIVVLSLNVEVGVAFWVRCRVFREDGGGGVGEQMAHL